jgi:hypothetical protein
MISYTIYSGQLDGANNHDGVDNQREQVSDINNK